MSEHMSDHDALEGYERALRSIESGGLHLVAIARRRLVEVLDAINDGEFRKAMEAISDVQSAVAPLAHAQGYIAVADGAKLVQAEELEAGMVLHQLGEITEVELVNCGVQRCPTHVTVKCGTHEFEFRGNQELYVEERV